MAAKKQKTDPTYETRHKDDEGLPTYVNRLILASSPYLQQHAHNPTNWFMWGEEAFEKAKRENKPVLLSVGYSTCHWCHVMAKESFDDAEIAEYLNEHYVTIKVDREQRPDIDDRYMSAVRMMSGQAGRQAQRRRLLPLVARRDPGGPDRQAGRAGQRLLQCHQVREP